MTAQAPSDDMWSQDLDDGTSETSRKRWEGALSTAIALLFIAAYAVYSLLAASAFKIAMLIALAILLGACLAVGRQCLISADNPQENRSKLITTGLLNYIRIAAIAILIIAVGAYFFLN
ncbi:hypothetical protein IJT17_07360 [bacterium]|nr:hypothetical protein [bacterium]